MNRGKADVAAQKLAKRVKGSEQLPPYRWKQFRTCDQQ
jgi:hypothetical protein